VSKFLTWLEFDIVPVVDITDAVSVLAAGAEYANRSESALAKA